MSSEHPESEPRTEKRSAIRSALLYFGICFGICFVIAVSFGLGRGLTELEAYSKQYQEERALIEPFLASDPAFKEIKCSQRSNGGVSLMGTVPKQADWDRLHEQIIRFVGERRASEIMYGVQVFMEQ